MIIIYKYVKKTTPEMIKERSERMRRPERPPFPYHPVKTHKWYVDRIKERERIGDLAVEIFNSKFDDED